MATGLQWIPHPEAVGWQAYTIPDAPVIGGRIHDRGGLYVDPEFRGDRLSWFLTGLQWAVALSEGVDHVVSSFDQRRRDRFLRSRRCPGAARPTRDVEIGRAHV